MNDYFDPASYQLQCLGKRMGIPTLKFDDDGQCLLEIGETTVLIETIPDSDYLHCYADLGAIPDTERALILAELLCANLAYNKCGIIALDPTEKRAVLLLHIDVNTDAEIFIERFTLFSQRATLLQSRLIQAAYEQDDHIRKYHHYPKL
ncbi:type III secretion system chaperone [Candidatus Fukatsuia symbiotica]|uniref:Tir chaperone family protein n=1 Tax=Candidatus Fukatsuia symbiotica TaxID=1878942 RepID=A0A2U8I5G3_9GAMM|nr:type III secretion system chaperone [Candidatus Fukatsuia symbiotica]AWK14396.1 hypothetical protein CCS41_07765 [Candidatus Fukatsuia symbiotica]MEA9444665.1 type III secretion system chaperone [Candidatus Fukatsuia symbiotica]